MSYTTAVKAVKARLLYVSFSEGLFLTTEKFYYILMRLLINSTKETSKQAFMMIESNGNIWRNVLNNWHPLCK